MNTTTKTAPKADPKPGTKETPVEPKAAPADKAEILQAATAVKTESRKTAPAAKTAAKPQPVPAQPAPAKSLTKAKPSTPAARAKAKTAAVKPKAPAQAPKAAPKAAPKSATPAVVPAKDVSVVPNTAEAALRADVEAVRVFNEDNVEAVMAANVAFVDGIGTFNSLLFGIAQQSLERHVEVAKSVLQCTSIEELVKAQAAHAEAQCAIALENSGKLTNASVKVAEQTAAPITERVSSAVEKITASMAA